MATTIKEQNFPATPTVAPIGTVTNPPRTPLQSPDPKIRAAWQAALFNIRQKNRAGRPAL